MLVRPTSLSTFYTYSRLLCQVEWISLFEESSFVCVCVCVCVCVHQRTVLFPLKLCVWKKCPLPGVHFSGALVALTFGLDKETMRRLTWQSIKVSDFPTL